VIFRDELLNAEASDPNLRLAIATTRDPRQRSDDFERRFDRNTLREILTRWGESPARVYVCGSTPFVESVADALVQEGVAAARIRTERFGGVG
jgi:ferredoxin-NADP reductase